MFNIRAFSKFVNERKCNKQRNERGYSVIGMLLGVLLVALLAVGGWYGYGLMEGDGDGGVKTSVGNSTDIQEDVSEVQDVRSESDEKILEQMEELGD